MTTLSAEALAEISRAWASEPPIHAVHRLLAHISAQATALETLRKERDTAQDEAWANWNSFKRAEAELAALRAERDEAQKLLIVADAAMNPPDREGISLHEWNARLKAATAAIRAGMLPLTRNREE